MPPVLSVRLNPSIRGMRRGHYMQVVRAAPYLDADDRVVLEQAWTAACHADHWMSARMLEAGVAVAESALSKRFGWLAPLACRQLARAASYQWR